MMKMVSYFMGIISFRKYWDQLTKMFLNFLNTVDLNEKVCDKDAHKIGILLTPWLGLPVSWYAITIGLLLKSISNAKITFIVNDLWNSNNSFYHYYKTQQRSILSILRKHVVNKYCVDMVKLSNFEDKGIDENDKTIILQCAKINTIRYLGNSIKDKEHQSIIDRWIDTYNEMFGKIKKCSEEKWDRILLPGGAFQETGLFLDIFRRAGVDVITYDSGPGRYKLGINGCASQNGDTYRTAQEILSSECYKDKIQGIAQEILTNRMQMRPELSVVDGGRIIQNIAYKDSDYRVYDIVMFCNLEFDTAALGTHDAFADDYEWITETIKFVLANTEASIAIRQHPLKKLFPQIMTNETNIRKLFKGNSRVTFIGCDEKISSYNLIDGAKVLIVNTSTIGLEAGMLGKRVITDSHSYYHNAAFMRYSNDKEKYFNDIVNMLSSDMALNEEEKYEAAVYYFLTQKCSSVLTDFTSQPNDYKSWTKKTFKNLQEDESVKYMIKTIVELEAIDGQIYKDIVSAV